MVKTVTTARCLACGPLPGPDADLAARKHVAVGHAVVTVTEPARAE